MKLVLFLLVVFLVACQPVSPSPTTTLPSPHVVIETITPSPIPTLTLTPSATPTTEELIFPFTIDGLRQHNYQSGEIHIRKTLDENDFYTGYLIDYPSDGLTITGVMQIPKGDGPFPVIVMNHGFFSRSIYHSGDGTDRSSAYLAQHGYITLASDYRSWGESDIGASFFYSGLVIDVINLINAIPIHSRSRPGARRHLGAQHGWRGDDEGDNRSWWFRYALRNESFGRLDATASGYSTSVHVKAAVLYSTVSADDMDIINRWGMGCFGDIATGEQIIGCNSSDVIPIDLPMNLAKRLSLRSDRCGHTQKDRSNL